MCQLSSKLATFKFGAHHLIDRTETKTGHDASQFFSQVEEEVNLARDEGYRMIRSSSTADLTISKRFPSTHHMLRLSRELGSKDWVLRSYTDGASVEMALPHHDASHSDKSRRSKLEKKL